MMKLTIPKIIIILKHKISKTQVDATTPFDDLLVNEVGKRESLYDHSSSKNKNVGIRENNWKDIAKVLTWKVTYLYCGSGY